METNFLSSVLSLIFLLLISVFTFIISKKINFPYTVMLVFVWLLLVPLSQVGFFSFIDDFKLTPEILFFVFLPVLLFESAYNINYRQLVKNWKSIFSLAVVWLVISAFLIALALFYTLPFIWIEIPFIVCLLFWTLISATDPVAVLSLFKSMWAPRRLTLIFEWESLFNDWTALALFLVVLAIAIEWSSITWLTFVEWILSFTVMALWWIAFWIFTWVLFSKIIQKIKNDETLEITLTMILAHLTFIMAEIISHHANLFWFDIKISWVIATTIAAIIMWNYWRYKISPKVQEYMEKFWWFFAFIANSLVFILLWLILTQININFWDFILPIIVSIIIVMIARAISVYIPILFINIFKLEEKIPSSWQNLLAWWSLRWALALMMVLMVPDNFTMQWWNMDYSIKDFLIVITIWAIMFTLFIKAPTISPMMRYYKVNRLHELEEVEYEEWKILMNLKALKKLKTSLDKWYILKDEFENLKQKYEENLKESIENIKKLLKNNKDKAQDLIKRTLSLHALWIEKQYLKELFSYNEIDEHNFKYILHKISRQIERIENWQEQVKAIWEKNNYDFYEKIVNSFHKNPTFIDKYIKSRAKVIITRKVIKELNELKEIDFWFDNKAFDEVIKLYTDFYELAIKKKEEYFSKNKLDASWVETRLMEKSIFKLEEKVIHELFEKEIITPKLYLKFKEEIENNINIDVKSIL